MTFLQGASVASCAFAISLVIHGCGGGGSSGSTTTITTTVTTTTVTTTTVTTTTVTTLSKACRADQAQCSKCLNFECLECNDDYVFENGTVPGGRCVASCIGKPQPPSPERPATPFALQGKAWPQLCINAVEAHFFGIGDWGGTGEPGHTWTNPGKCSGRRLSESDAEVASDHPYRECTDVDHWAQKYVARQMGKVAPSSKPDYVLNVGDNFYPGGIVRSCGNDPHPGEDPTGQWNAQFDEVYGGIAELQGKPWMSVLGNHDYGGYSWFNGWDQQIFNTWERKGDWLLPAQYWSRRVQYLDFAVEYFFVDSNVADVWDHNPNHYICQHDPTLNCWGVNQSTCDYWFNDIWNKGKIMVEEGLKKSTAEWHILVTHFPPPTILADKDYQRIFSKYPMDLVLTGHTHEQTHGIDKNTGIPWIISGGGGGVTTDSNPDYPGGHDVAYGFVDFAINRTSLKFDMHTWGGKDASIIILDSATITSHKHKSSRYSSELVYA